MRYRGIDDAQEYSYVWFNDDGKSVAVLHCVLWLNALTHSTHPHMLSNFSRTMNPFCARQFIIFANNETDSSRLSQQLMFAAADSKAKTNGTFEFFITFIPHVYREVAALSHTVRRHPAGIFFFFSWARPAWFMTENQRARTFAPENNNSNRIAEEKNEMKKKRKSDFFFFILSLFLCFCSRNSWSIYAWHAHEISAFHARMSLCRQPLLGLIIQSWSVLFHLNLRDSSSEHTNMQLQYLITLKLSTNLHTYTIFLPNCYYFAGFATAADAKQWNRGWIEKSVC